MEALLNEVGVAMVNELHRIVSYEPRFRSGHEAYGAICETKENVESAVETVRNSFQDFWFAVKTEDFETQKNALMSLRDVALHGAAELIQTAAMAQKAMDSMNG